MLYVWGEYGAVHYLQFNQKVYFTWMMKWVPIAGNQLQGIMFKQMY